MNPGNDGLSHIVIILAIGGSSFPCMCCFYTHRKTQSHAAKICLVVNSACLISGTNERVLIKLCIGELTTDTLVNDILIRTTLFPHFVFETKLFISQYPLP